jgi:cytidine deaminase|tara:strand:- start:672 stop:836 length:165 start_codon:yes stop_codon:yes gene_type:complete
LLYDQLDNEGNLVHPVFSTDEWQEFDEGFLAENHTQYLACGDCHEVIEEYTHTN